MPTVTELLEAERAKVSALVDALRDTARDVDDLRLNPRMATTGMDDLLREHHMSICKRIDDLGALSSTPVQESAPSRDESEPAPDETEWPVDPPQGCEVFGGKRVWYTRVHGFLLADRSESRRDAVVSAWNCATDFGEHGNAPQASAPGRVPLQHDADVSEDCTACREMVRTGACEGSFVYDTKTQTISDVCSDCGGHSHEHDVMRVPPGHVICPACVHTFLVGADAHGRPFAARAPSPERDPEGWESKEWRERRGLLTLEEARLMPDRVAFGNKMHAKGYAAALEDTRAASPERDIRALLNGAAQTVTPSEPERDIRDFACTELGGLYRMLTETDVDRRELGLRAKKACDRIDDWPLVTQTVTPSEPVPPFGPECPCRDDHTSWCPLSPDYVAVPEPPLETESAVPAGWKCSIGKRIVYTRHNGESLCPTSIGVCRDRTVSVDDPHDDLTVVELHAVLSYHLARNGSAT